MCQGLKGPHRLCCKDYRLSLPTTYLQWGRGNI